MRWGIVFAAAIALAGCGQKSRQVTENQSSVDEKTAAASENAVTIAGNARSVSTNAPTPESAGGNQTGSLPPANAALRFVGTWATSAANCTSKPWRFTAKELTTKDGPRCTFYNVAKVPGGYDLAAECPTKKPVQRDLLKVRFAESARAMLLESNAMPPTGLVYCGK